MEIMKDNYAEQLDAIAVDSHTNAINNNLSNSCETFLLFYSNCCSVISSDTINFITNKYLINESSEKKQMMSTIIESFFKLHIEETKNIIDEEILSVLNTIGNEQINYDNVLNDKVPVIIDKITDSYNSDIVELLCALGEIDNSYIEDIKSYFLNIVLNKLITILKTNMILYIKSTINKKREEDDKLAEIRNINAEIIANVKKVA